jgi:hypothetical protein
MSDEEQPTEKRFTEAVKSGDYKDEIKQKTDPFESTNQAAATDLSNFPNMPNVRRSPESQKLFDQLGDEKAFAVRDIGLAKEITLGAKKYTRNVINAKIRNELVKIDTAIENARYKPNFKAIEWEAVKAKCKLIWNIDVDDNTDTEALYRIAEATDIVVDNRFR